MRLRTGTMVVALTLALALGVAQPAAAQVPPHQFYGSSERGSSALVNGRLAPDGSTVSAVNQRGAVVASTVVEAGDWVLRIDSRDAREVRFRIGGSSLSDTYAVTAGALTEVRLALTAAVPRQPKTVTPKPGLELYTVREGDTLASIAAASDISEADLLARNPQLENAGDIAPGDVIYLRELVAAAPPAPAPEPAPSPVPEEPPVPLPAADVEPEPAPAAPAIAPAALPSDGGGPSWMMPALLVAVVGLALALVALWRRRSPAPPSEPAVGSPDDPAEAEAIPASGLARLRQEQEQVDADAVFQVRYELPSEERAAARQRVNYIPPVAAGPATPEAETLEAATPEAATPEAGGPVPGTPGAVMPAAASVSPPLTTAPPEVVGEVEEDEDADEADAAAPTPISPGGMTVCVALTGGGRRCADAVRGAGLTLCPAHDRLARTGGTVLHWESGQAIPEVTRAEGSAAG